MRFYYLITLFGDNLAPLGSFYSLSTLNLTNVGGPGARGPGALGPGGGLGVGTIRATGHVLRYIYFQKMKILGALRAHFITFRNLPSRLACI